MKNDEEMQTDGQDAAGLEEINALWNQIHELIERGGELFGEGDYEEAFPPLLKSYGMLTDMKYSPWFEEHVSEREHMYWLGWVCYRIAFSYSEVEDYGGEYAQGELDYLNSLDAYEQ